MKTRLRVSAVFSLNKQLSEKRTHFTLADEGLEGPGEYHTHD